MIEELPTPTVGLHTRNGGKVPSQGSLVSTGKGHWQVNCHSQEDGQSYWETEGGGITTTLTITGTQDGCHQGCPGLGVVTHSHILWSQTQMFCK
jgi:hypothetical protein